MFYDGDIARADLTDEHRRLHALAGEWRGEEVMHESRWYVAGPAISHVSARVDLGGLYVIQDYRQTRDGKTIFAGHGVFTWDREDRRVKLFWHDSLGYDAPAPAAGGWKDGTLVLLRGSLRGGARHIYEFPDADTYTLRIQFSPDAEGWSDVLTGVYRRQTVIP
jgi:hypothetical protein